MPHRVGTTWTAALLGPVLGLVVLGLVVLGGCGQPRPGADPAPAPASSAPVPSTPVRVSGGAGAVAVAVVTASNAGGEVVPYATVLQGPGALRDLVSSLAPSARVSVREAVEAAEVPAGRLLLGAVVAIGCDPPSGLRVERTPEGYRVNAQVPKPGVQCLVPMTSVALLHVPAP